MRIFLIILALAFSSLFAQNNYSFFEQHHQERHFEVPENTVSRNWDSLQAADAQLSLQPGDSLGAVLSTLFGTNTTFRNGPTMATDGVRLPMYRKAQFNTFRYPAGSGSNKFFWDGNIPPDFRINDVNPIDGSRNNILDTDLYADFLDSTGAEGIIAVNYFYARYGQTASGTRQDRVQQAADYAAEWVRHMNITREANIKYWEIGNECYGRWETGWDVNGSIVTGKEYGEDLRIFANAMKAVDTTIKIGAVLHHTDSVWNKGVLQEVYDAADFMIVHQYFTPVTENAFDFLGNVGKVGEIADMVRNQVTRYTPKPADYFPITMTEFNCRGRHRITMANGIFTTQVLGELIKNQYSLASIWVSEWKHNDTDEKATSGIMAVEDPNQPDYSARPSYMPFYLYNQCFGDKMIGARVQGNDSIIAYASQFSSGEYGLVIVNQSASETQLSIDGVNWDQAFWHELYADNINLGNTRFYLNGEGPNTAGGGPLHFDQIPFYQNQYRQGHTFTTKAWSVNFLVLRSETSSPTGFEQMEKPRMQIYPNPTDQTLHIETDIAVEQISVMDIKGRLLWEKEGSCEKVDVSDLKDGLYFLGIRSNGHTWWNEFVID